MSSRRFSSQHIASRAFGLLVYGFAGFTRLTTGTAEPSLAGIAFALGAFMLASHFALRPTPLGWLFRWEKPFPARALGPDWLNALLVYGGAAGILGSFFLH